MTPGGEKYPKGVLVAYYVTLAAFFVASFYPQYRVWGISWWAYFPLWVKFGLLAIGAVAPFAADRLIDKLLAGRDDITPKTYRWLVGGFAVTMVSLFYLLRARTHFLGDGYTLLRLLGSENPFIKPRNFGGTIFQHWVLKLLGGKAEADALIAYQVVSFLSGILFFAVALWLAAKLFQTKLNRLLFILTMGSGGFVLLFFGYVENYSLFVVSVFGYTGVAYLATRGTVSRLWILLAQGAAVFLHIFGVVFIPATIAVLIANSRFSTWARNSKRRVQMMLVLVLLVVATAGFTFAFQKSFFFRLAILPLLNNEFTVEHYTLFSLPHLIDILNLLLVIFPGLFVGLVALSKGKTSVRWLSTIELPVALSVAGSLGAAMLFAPGLGMPRDWDLFALSGIPLLASIVYLLLTSRSDGGIKVVLAISMLGMLSLLPRAITFASPKLAVKHVEAYTNLDVAKSASTRFLLYKHYVQIGEPREAARIDSAWTRLDPDSYLMNAAIENGTVADSVNLMPILRRCTKRNPLNWTAWGNIGVLALRQKAFDSALYYLQVSDGLNPYNPATNLNLGYALFNLKDYTKAERHLQEALHLDSTLLTTSVLLLFADLYRESNQESKYVQTFGQIADRPDAPPKYVMGWIELLLRQDNYISAVERINYAIGIQIDSAYVRSLLSRYPRLQQSIKL
jgi:tetratricopeptide (TPR) repeat protein